MDIKRVAFETRPVKSTRPAVANAKPIEMQAAPATPAPAQSSAPAGKQIGREEIAAIVDHFLAGRGTPSAAATGGHATLHASESPAPYQSMTDVSGVGKYAAPEAAPHAEAAPTAVASNGGNGARSEAQASPPSQPVAPPSAPAAPASAAPTAQSSNGNSRKAVDFVSEDDVRRAIQKGEKIYVNARTIITPSARDMGDPAEVFAKV
jgi:hypothetical protein